MTSTRRLVLAMLALAFTVVPAQASLIGLSVDGTLSAAGGVSEPFTSPAVIGGGVEFEGQVLATFIGDPFDVSADFTSSALLLTTTYVGFFSGGAQGDLFGVSFVFSGSPQILSVTASASNPGGVSSLSFANNTLTIDVFDEFIFTQNVPITWQFDIETAAVPEPATLLMFGVGLAGMGARRWRQRKAT